MPCSRPPTLGLFSCGHILQALCQRGKASRLPHDDFKIVTKCHPKPRPYCHSESAAADEESGAYADRNRYGIVLSLGPLRLMKITGSPVNPIAIF